MAVGKSTQAPTSRLPPIQTLPSCTVAELTDALNYLRLLYNPEVRGSKRRRKDVQKSQPITNDESPTLDSFERAYAVRWLTAVISQGRHWEQTFPELTENVAALLAVCAGTSAAGVVHRTFVFPFNLDPVKIHIRDIPLDNHDFSSVGAQTWGGACVLSELLVDTPEAFFPRLGRPLRILELGSGTGLVSLTAGQLCLRGAAGQGHHVIACTDFYPSVLANLQTNINSNFASPDLSSLQIASHFLDWSIFASQDGILSAPFDQPFDLVLGADIIYEAQHAIWIKGCLETLLRRPSDDASLAPRFHLVIPLRQTFSAESETVETVFSPVAVPQQKLTIKGKELITCDADSEGGEIVQYAYYQIGWSQLEKVLEVDGD